MGGRKGKMACAMGSSRKPVALTPCCRQHLSPPFENREGWGILR